MTNLQKKEIVITIENAITNLGSANKVAIKCGVSSATISQMKSENWDLIRDDLWLKVASALGHNFSEWKVAPTTNFKMMQSAIGTAKKQKLFIPIAYNAGAGKTEGIKGFIATSSEPYNYFLKCRQWAAREFIENLLLNLGLAIPRGYNSIDSLGQTVIDFFVERKMYAPTLILDQANSLKASAIKFIIHLYNELEDEMSLIVVGTEALEVEIKRGVRYNKGGYDEIDSRLGRNYIKLIGNTLNDTRRICEANGIIDKKQQKSIFDECRPKYKMVEIGGSKTQILVVEDTRRIKRIVIRERSIISNKRKEVLSA
jgi:hypothetical protein